VRILAKPWTIENGMLTPTLKLKRGPIRARYADEIDELYGDARAK
jgi:long-chain acyl-CoA synthetase